MSLALCVLGCRSGSAALVRRARTAAEAYFALGSSPSADPASPAEAHANVVVVCGGRAWDGRVEADELARMLEDAGVPHDVIRRERTSLDTRGNAREAAKILGRGHDVLLVTCTWHLPRAKRLFERAGLRVTMTRGADPPSPTLFERAYWRARERVSSLKDLVGLVFLVGFLVTACKGTPATASDAGTDAGGTFDAVAIARAEDLRHAKDIPPEVRTSHDVVARRRSARALARIADAASIDGLVAHLADEDPEVVEWAAYGLGYACKGREDPTVRQLAARAAGFSGASPKRAPEDDARTAIARAIGRCAGPLSENTLVGLLRSRGTWTDPALLGLGDLATKKKQLGPDAFAALLEVITEGAKGTPHDMAFYALGRSDPGEAFAARVAEAARVALGRPGEARILAIRTLGRAGKESPKETAADLARVVTDAKGYSAGERAEAARAMIALGDQSTIAGAITELTPDTKDSIGIAALAGPDFHVLYTLLGGLAPEAPKKVEPSLNAIASLTPPTQPRPGFARRLADLRCSAALALARGAYDLEILRKCDAPTSESSERARLASLLRRPLKGERLEAFRALAKSEHLRIREAAVEALASHPEAGETGIAILADALGAKEAGFVATAAELLDAHPERAMALAESEKRAALDPKSPPPTAHPAQEIAPAITKALAAALAKPWPEDVFETRLALMEAASTLKVQTGEIEKACKDPNPVVRDRAAKLLRKACDVPDHDPKLAAEVGHTLAKPTKIVLTTDASELSITLDPDLAPVTATRIVALAKAGFYKGIEVHRVVPGFVAQLGDPSGDGYGGSGTSLRCETSPVPFAPLDVGMALAGRDTGSSQFFVTLARTPHLDGEYTRVGHADGDWASVAQGDVIADARVVE